jgi:hypothetical protein
MPKVSYPLQKLYFLRFLPYLVGRTGPYGPAREKFIFRIIIHIVLSTCKNNLNYIGDLDFSDPLFLSHIFRLFAFLIDFY